MISNDYAEVRVLLNQYYEKTARKYGSYHDHDSKKISKELKDIPTDDGTEASINRKQGVLGINRQAIRGMKYNWDNMTISYYFGSSNVKWQNIIRTALHHIEMETCIRFKKIRKNGANWNYIYFIQAEGCWSSVGKVGGRQSISIGIGCETMGIVAHEVLHALGLWHEQSRSDRDNNIWINYINIYPGTQGNFEKRTLSNTDNMGLSYDFGSLMHYSSKAFTNNFARNTIETRDHRYQQTIGQRNAISFKDAKMINLRYCYDICKNKMTCYNGGYTDPNNCNQCKCPTGLGGKDCLSVEKSRTSNCGGDLLANNDYQTITSIGLYGNIHCVWRIKSKARVLVYISELQLPCKVTCTSYLELKFKADMVPTGSRHCCGSSKTRITSENDTFIIIYTIHDLIYNLTPNTWGFKLYYRLYDLNVPISTNKNLTTTTASISLSSLSPPPRTTLTKVTTTTITTIKTTATTATATKLATTTITKLLTTATESSIWSTWGKWSLCSMTCGGCGEQRRVRACYGKNQNCPGHKKEMKRCGDRRCQIQTNFECIGRIIMPCSLYQTLQFATDQNAYMPVSDKLIVNQHKYKQHVKSAFSDEKLCETYFYYLCSMKMVTVYMDRKIKDNNNWLRLDKRGCCIGYHYNGTICIPD
ncbi:Zinc metalloproteinase nas-37 [Dirofilaria immitis]